MTPRVPPHGLRRLFQEIHAAQASPSRGDCHVHNDKVQRVGAVIPTERCRDPKTFSLLPDIQPGVPKTLLRLARTALGQITSLVVAVLRPREGLPTCATPERSRKSTAASRKQLSISDTHLSRSSIVSSATPVCSSRTSCCHCYYSQRGNLRSRPRRFFSPFAPACPLIEA